MILPEPPTAEDIARRYRRVGHQLNELGHALGSRAVSDLWEAFRYIRINDAMIISLHIPQLYAIVRGKVGKAVEFGLNWGITRLRGGFLVATLARNKDELHDSKFVVRAAKDHEAMFGKPPKAYRRGIRIAVQITGQTPSSEQTWYGSGRET